MGQSGQQKGAKNRQDLSVEDRRKVVATNILAGATYREIADALGVSPATVADDFKAILKEWRKHYAGDIDKWAQVQLRRLDVLLNAIWDKARNGNVDCIDRALKIMERQEKILGFGSSNVNIVQGETVNIHATNIDHLKTIFQLMGQRERYVAEHPNPDPESSD